jgi:phosphatidylserine/phosphatidylglycerophosphate/cardiolipin synthase-like enzyme
VVILGWDLDSRARLGPGGGAEPLVPPVSEFLPAVAAANPDLNIYILTWSFPLLFANKRDPKLVSGRDPFKHPRVHLKFDSTHPPGASHHQKIVVVDDSLAFAGGMDIAGGRWDTPEHLACDPRRPGKDRPYPPYHDVMAMVDGDAARALGEIVRDRWHRSTGTALADVSHQTDIWPNRVTPDLRDVSIGVSRTDVKPDGTDLCREVEQLHLDLFDAARDTIYIENQYLTSATLVSALSRRLQTIDGPEVVIVLPLNNEGWLEEHTIEALRIGSIRQLRQADRFDRLRICYPTTPNLGDDVIGVHSKIQVVDDRLLRVGSSNLTNRSMRLDTECDLTIEAASAAQRAVIATLRNRLIGEHLGMTEESVHTFLAEDASLVRLVDSHRAASRCLCDVPSEDESAEVIAQSTLVDPARPITGDVVIEALASSVAESRIKRLLLFALVGVATAAVAIVAYRRHVNAT